MNLKNVAAVRATNIIPFDGIIKPLSNVPYLHKVIGVEYSARMSDLLHKKGIIPLLDYSRMFENDYYDTKVKEASDITKEYLPYLSDYNSMVLFSLNGLCPDDNEHGFANNTFSNKKCAIIDSLEHHINQVISLNPTDTAIKGNVHLSEEAIILIEENYYVSLEDAQKEMLANLNLKVKTFNGSLKDAVYNELSMSGKYIPEELSLSASTGGFKYSDTSGSQLENIKEITQFYGLSQKKYYDLITSRDKTISKYEEVCNEFENAVIVQEYYTRLFLELLLRELHASEYMIQQLENRSNLYNKNYMESIMILIEEYGIDNYKKFVDAYNRDLEEKQKNNTLFTPQEIVDNYNQTKRNL